MGKQLVGAGGVLLAVLVAGCAQPSGPIAQGSAETSQPPTPTQAASAPTDTPNANPPTQPPPSPALVADDDPPPREGSVRYDLDRALDDMKQQLHFPAPQDAVKTASDYLQDASYAESNIMFLYWTGKGDKIIYSTASTPLSPCPLKEGRFDDEMALESLDYSEVAKLHIPIDSVGAGPFQAEGGMRQCFEHSTRGAIMAAMNLQFQIPRVVGYAGDAVQERVFYSKTRRTFNAINFISSSDFDPNNIGPKYEFISVTGHRLNRVDETGIEVDIFNYYPTPDGDGLMAQVPMVMVWEKGDWRIGAIGDELVLDEHPEDFVLLSGFAGSSDDENPDGQ